MFMRKFWRNYSSEYAKKALMFLSLQRNWEVGGHKAASGCSFSLRYLSEFLERVRKF